MAAICCYVNSDVIATLIITNCHLHQIQHIPRMESLLAGYSRSDSEARVILDEAILEMTLEAWAEWGLALTTQS